MEFDTFQKVNQEIDEVGLFTKVTEVRKQKEVEITKTYWQRSSVLWDLRNERGEHDDGMAEQLVEKNVRRRAALLFARAKTYVLARQKMEEVLEKGPYRSLENLSDEEKINWSTWVVYYLHAQELLPTEDFVELIDGQGDLIGMKKLPMKRGEA